MNIHKPNKGFSFSKNINQIETAERIKRLRNERGITTYKIAEDLKTSRSYYSQLENGKITITKRFINKLAEYYHIPIETIVSYDKDFNLGFYEGTVEINKHIDSFYFNVYGIHRKLFESESSYIIDLIVQSVGLRIVPETLYEIAERDCPDFFHMYEDCGYHNNSFSQEELDEMEEQYKRDIVHFKLLKGNKEICIWKADEFYKLEEYLRNSLLGCIEHSINNSHVSDIKSRKKELDSAFASTESDNVIGQRIESLKKELSKLEDFYIRRGHDAKSQRDGDDL